MSIPIALFNQQDQLFTATSMSTDITGTIRDIGEARTIAAQMTWASGTSPVGSLQLQCSNNSNNWVIVSSVSVSGASGTVGINFDLPGYFYARLVYSRTSGTATSTNTFLSAKR